MIFPKFIFHFLFCVLLVGQVLGLPIIPRTPNPPSSASSLETLGKRWPDADSTTLLEVRAPELDLGLALAQLETRELLEAFELYERSPSPAEGDDKKKPIRPLPPIPQTPPKTPPPPPSQPPRRSGGVQVNAVAGGSGIKRNQYGEIIDPEVKFHKGKKTFDRPAKGPEGPRDPRRSPSPPARVASPPNPVSNQQNQQQQPAVAQTQAQTRPRGQSRARPPSPAGPRSKNGSK